jgi:hypothetical protein
MVTPTRRRILAVAGAAALAGCSSPDEQSEPQNATTGPTSSQTESGESAATVPTADDRLPLPMSPEQLREEARSGGPPKDGIPSIDDPQFISPDAAEFLDPGDPVFGVARDGVAKAYPQKILAQHEIVNDDLAGTPVGVTYCPLTGTVQGFERGETTFGVSGRLINNNLVMYDRATEAWWPQILATSIPGPWNEDPPIRTLREFRLIWATWAQWREHNPDTDVLSRDTGYANNYARDPYGSYNPRDGYYANEDPLFPALKNDDRYHNKTVFMGARTPEGAAAFRKSSLRDGLLLTGEIGETPVVAVPDARYETAYVYLNPDEHDYKVDGNDVVGPDGASRAPDRLALTRIHTFDAMWFAWAGYYPETNVYE